MTGLSPEIPYRGGAFMNAKPIRVESRFNRVIKESLIRELYHQRLITRHQFEKLMQMQRKP